jgi:hypothetical protein
MILCLPCGSCSNHRAEPRGQTAVRMLYASGRLAAARTQGTRGAVLSQGVLAALNTLLRGVELAAESPRCAQPTA